MCSVNHEKAPHVAGAHATFTEHTYFSMLSQSSIYCSALNVNNSNRALFCRTRAEFENMVLNNGRGLKWGVVWQTCLAAISKVRL